MPTFIPNRRTSLVVRIFAPLAVVAVIWTAAAAATQTAPTCRVYSAEEVRTATGATTGTIAQSCTFDLATFSRVCRLRTRLSHTSFDLTLTDKYNSAADFVDEVRVVPPIARIQTQSRRFTSGSAPNADLKYEYDGARRQTRLSTNMAGNLLVTTYNGWDPQGRPTGAVVSSKASTITLQYKYDDAARTMTTTGPGSVQIDTYDADGNMIREEATNASGKTVFAVKISKTDKVCR